MKPYFYKITNIINNKYYYGTGSKPLGTHYFGSSFLLKRAIKKYGIENFKFEVLKQFETRNKAFEFEDRFLKIFKIWVNMLQREKQKLQIQINLNQKRKKNYLL